MSGFWFPSQPFAQPLTVLTNRLDHPNLGRSSLPCLVPTAGLDSQYKHTKNSNPQRIRRAMTITRPHTKISRRGEFRSAGSIFVRSIFHLFSKYLSKWFPNKCRPGRFRFISLNTLFLRSQVLLRCLGLFGNWFLLRKSSGYVCAR